MDIAKTLDVLLLLTVISYTVLLLPILANPAQAWALFRSDSSAAPLRDLVDSIAGVRAVTQAATIYGAVWAYARFSKKDLPRLHTRGIWMVVTLVALRSLVLAERLSFIEFSLAVSLFAMTGTTSRKFRAGLAFAPLLLPVVFAFFEYFRSWKAGYDRVYGSYVGYIGDRLSSYYVAASNNGTGLVETYGNLATYRYPVSSLLEIPGVSSILNIPWMDPLPVFLRGLADPQFNTTTGVYPYVLAYGFVPAMLVMLGIGTLLGKTWKAFRGAELSRLGLLYPAALTGVLQIPLIAYFSEPRFLAYVLVLLVAVRTQKT